MEGWGFNMGSFSRGYVASIGGGALVGYVLGGAPLAVLSLPSVWIGISAGTGAVIGGIYGALWVRRDRRRRWDGQTDEAKTR
jgi:membrane associated rhomboid family serine protease